MGPLIGCLSENVIFNLLYHFSNSKNKIRNFDDVDYQWIQITDFLEAIVFDLKEKGKYFAYLEWNENEECYIQQIEKITKMNGKHYGDIQEKLKKIYFKFKRI